MHKLQTGLGTFQSQPLRRGGRFSCSIRKRIVLTWLAFFCFFFNYALRVNLSIAIVGMVNHTAVSMQHASYNGTSNSSSTGDSSDDQMTDGTFVWDNSTEALLLSSFFWGYLLTHLLGGRLSEYYGSKQLLGIGILVSAICTLLTPVAASIHWKVLIAVRVIIGIALGPSYPAMHSMLALWIPRLERTTLGAIIYSGSTWGMIFSYPVTGAITESLGWKSAFYLMGIFAVIWVIVWEVVIYDSPDTHPTITDEEREYLRHAIGESKAGVVSPPIPWKSLFTSLPCWACMLTQTCFNWFIYTYQTSLPKFMSFLDFGLSESGAYMGSSLVLVVFIAYIYAFLSDWLVSKEYISRTVQRKIMNTMAQWGVATSLVILSQIGESKITFLVINYINALFTSAVNSGYLVNHIDISPNYAGTILGISNSFCTIIGIIVPLYNLNMLSHETTFNEWCRVFLTNAGVLYFGGLLFIVFGSGKVQSWNNPKNMNGIRRDVEEERRLKEEQPIG